MSNSYTTQGYYGSGNTPCTIFVYQDRRGLNWYVIEDSCNINACWEPIELGTDVETLQDVDCMTCQEPCQTLEDLIGHVDNYDEYLDSQED